jgi:hypothetical protein
LRGIDYDAENGALVVEGGYRTERRGGSFAAPLEQIFDVALVAFRGAAAEYGRATQGQRLKLALLDQPTAIFEQGVQKSGLRLLSSDGEAVWISTFTYVSERDGFPENPDSAAKLVIRHVASLVAQFNGHLEVQVAPFVPGDLRRIQLDVELPAQRRTVGEIDAFARTLRTRANDGAAHFLGTPEGVIGALSFSPAALVGQMESQWLEVKRELYDLSKVQQKIELAKDVAALANSGGGVIVFGFTTKSGPAGDEITRPRGVRTCDLKENQYMQVLRTRIHPFPEQIVVGRASDTDAGFAYLRVPRQPEELYPFMLRQTASKGGVQTTSLSIPIRTGANIEYSNPESIHSLIVAGRAALRVADS